MILELRRNDGKRRPELIVVPPNEIQIAILVSRHSWRDELSQDLGGINRKEAGTSRCLSEITAVDRKAATAGRDARCFSVRN